MAHGEIPVIILCNEVDDPDDSELMELVHKVCKKVESIFGVTNRKDVLDAVNFKNKVPTTTHKPSPAFIPISAENAFVYRAASTLQAQDLRKLDKTTLIRLDRKKWVSINGKN